MLGVHCDLSKDLFQFKGKYREGKINSYIGFVYN